MTEIPTQWLRQFAKIDNAWRDGDFDYAREQLRQLAYEARSGDAPPVVHAKLKVLTQNFTRSDPMYADVMKVALPAISANREIVQSALFKLFPQFDTEQFRYAMYYGEVIGDVVRSKKGSSYSLSLPEIMPPLQKWEAPNTMPLIEERQRRALERKKQMECLKEFRPFWQLVGGCAEGGKKTRLADDDYWQKGCTPWNCTKLDCRCRVDSLTTTEFARYVENGCEDDSAAIELLKKWHENEKALLPFINLNLTVSLLP
jgi:hypothetical protein